MYYIYRKFPRQFVEYERFETLGEANKFKKEHKLSGVIISKLDHKEFNHRHRKQFLNTYDADAVNLLKELGDEITHVSNHLYNIEKLYRRLKKRIKED